MVTIPLTEGSYTARSVIAAAQRCVNLYPEINQRQFLQGLPQGVAPALVTHLPTPGLRPLAQATAGGEVRGLFRANNNQLYTVVGNTLYLVTPQWTLQRLGVMATSKGQVSMMDNGRTLIIVDSSITGYVLDLATNTFGTINDPAFYGSAKVDYIASYMVFNQIKTQNFYTTLSNQIPQSTLNGNPSLPNYANQALNALYIAQKAGYGDNIITFVSLDRQIWFFGQLTTEIWYVSGGATFPLAVTPNGLIEHGCGAVFSVSKIDDTVMWLSITSTGSPIVLQGSGYTAERVSTNAIENEIQSYPRVDDAISMVYQQQGHSFYVLTFPSAGKTWVYDNSTQEWHERMYLDGNGNERRWRPNCIAAAYGQVVAGDFENGILYAIDLNTYTDNGQPIKRIRGFPHFLQEGKRVMYQRFCADIQCGEESGNVLVPVGEPSVVTLPGLSINFTNPPTTGTFGVPLEFTGDVVVAGNAVEIAFGTSATVPPTGGWVAATVIGGTWSGVVTPGS